MQKVWKFVVGLMVIVFGSMGFSSKTFAASWNLTKGGDGIVGVTAGNKVIFMGGELPNTTGTKTYNDVVDIYDVSSGLKTSYQGLGGRRNIKTVNVGDKAVFIGGQGYIFASGAGIMPSGSFELYDSANNSWVYGSMPNPRDGHAITALENKVYVAGGLSYYFDRLYGYIKYSTRDVDVFDTLTRTWSVAGQLSTPRSGLSATSVCGKVLFAGGSSDIVDIYDSSTNSWSIAHLSIARSEISAVTVGSKAYFLGGRDNLGLTDRIDIFDCGTGSWSVDTMPFSISATDHVGVIGNKIFLSGRTSGNNGGYVTFHNIIDVYDTSSQLWSKFGVYDGRSGFGITSAFDKIYLGGGYGWTGTCCTQGYSKHVDELLVPQNQPPVSDAGLDIAESEGSQVLFSGFGSSDPDGVADIVSYNWDFGDGQYGSGVSASHVYVDDGTYTATLTVMDSAGHTASDSVVVTVNNVAPVVGPLTPITAVLPGVTVSTSASYSDAGINDTHTASFDWGDGNNTEGVVGGGGVSGSHIYSTPGVYSVTLTVTDDGQASGTATTQVTILTTTQAMQNLVDLVETFNLQQGIANNLDAKLDAAMGALDDINANNDGAAINALQAFINAVEAQRGNHITDAQADQLIHDAQLILSNL